MSEKIHLCPTCGGDRSSEIARQAIMYVMKKYNCTGDMMDAGGRSFTFAERGYVHVGDQCNHCDFVTIANFLGIPKE